MKTNITRSDSKMYGNSLHFDVMYNVKPFLALGAGVGLDRYENAGGFNTAPIFVAAQYRPLLKRLPNGYVYTNLGYGVSGSDMYSGCLFDLGVGYRKMFRKHFGLNFQVGYDLRQFRNVPCYGWEIGDETIDLVYIGDKNILRHSLSLGFGLVF